MKISSTLHSALHRAVRFDLFLARVVPETAENRDENTRNTCWTPMRWFPKEGTLVLAQFKVSLGIVVWNPDLFLLSRAPKNINIWHTLRLNICPTDLSSWKLKLSSVCERRGHSSLFFYVFRACCYKHRLIACIWEHERAQKNLPFFLMVSLLTGAALRGGNEWQLPLKKIKACHPRLPHYL